MRTLRSLLAGLVLSAALSACGAAAPTIPADIGTVVALTMGALTPPAPQATPSLPPSPTPLLPHSLYFLRNDNTGIQQVYKLARDGTTLQQLTFEPAAVDIYDVSGVDGGIAYVSANQLLWADHNGAGRRVLVDGGTPPADNNFTQRVGSPVWSPDGGTIAFAFNGLNFYAINTGLTNRVLEDQIDTSAGFPVVRELYGPNKYSPDGSKLLMNIGYYESGTLAVYDIASGSFVRFSHPDGSAVCCAATWVPDGSGLYVANREIGMLDAGLWYVSVASSDVTTLLPGSAPDDTYNSAAEPIVGPDALLYFFFNNLTTSPTLHSPLYMVRSESDGVTGRTQLRPEAFENINEILWSPDASLAILAVGASPDVYAGGQATMVYSDGRPVSILSDYAVRMRWGP
jgi:hypothetical protein